MTLRGNKVLARCREDGALIDEGGRVEIRYRKSDAKAYRAGVRNLSESENETVFPDDHCVEGQPVDAASGVQSKSATKSSTKSAGGGSKIKAGQSPSSAPTKPAPGEVLVYCDGGCRQNPGPAALGVIMIDDEGRRELSEFLGHGTNNIAELTAILRAAQAMKDPQKPLRIYTDSKYSIDMLTKGWKPKKNGELIAEVKQALDKLADVQLFHVRGHVGVVLNERADELANEALDNQASSGWVEIG